MKCKSCEKDLCKGNTTGYCRACSNARPEIREKNSAAVMKSYSEGTRKVLGEEAYAQLKRGRIKGNQSKIDRAVLSQFCRGLTATNVLIKKWLINELGRDYKCALCGIQRWREEYLTLDLDHIDGNSSNNELDNLRFLCPNCHSQTDTFRGKNINTGKKKVSDEDLEQAIKQSTSIREALLKVGLAPKGGNYSRAYKLKANTFLNS